MVSALIVWCWHSYFAGKQGQGWIFSTSLLLCALEQGQLSSPLPLHAPSPTCLCFPGGCVGETCSNGWWGYVNDWMSNVAKKLSAFLQVLSENGRTDLFPAVDGGSGAVCSRVSSLPVCCPSNLGSLPTNTKLAPTVPTTYWNSWKELLFFQAIFFC